LRPTEKTTGHYLPCLRRGNENYTNEHYHATHRLTGTYDPKEVLPNPNSTHHRPVNRPLHPATHTCAQKTTDFDSGGLDNLINLLQRSILREKNRPSLTYR
jgi:hypothetical protein